MVTLVRVGNDPAHYSVLSCDKVALKKLIAHCIARRWWFMAQHSDDMWYLTVSQAVDLTAFSKVAQFRFETL